MPLELTSRWAFKALLVLGVLSVAAARRRHWPGIIIMAVTATFALLHRRHVPFFAVAAIAFLPYHMSSLLDRLVASLPNRVAARPGFVRALGVVMLGWLTLASVLHLVRLDPWHLQVPPWFYPVGAIEFVRLNELHGNLATPFNWGEYALWKLYPQVKVSFDGRYETVYTPSTTTDNLNFMASQGDWRRLLREYPTDMVLVDRRSAAVQAMANEPGWMAVYADPISALFLRRGASGRPWRWPPLSDGTIP